MDHFIGFDILLRSFLGREKKLHLYGPPGFLNNVEGRLAGYNWNLVHEFEGEFRLKVTEVHPSRTLTREYFCKNRFSSGEALQESPFTGTLLRESAFHVASFTGNRIAVITPVKGSEQRLRTFARLKGMEDKIHSVLYAGVSIPDLESGSPGAEEFVYAAGNEAVEKGADTLIFGCAGMGWVVDKIASRFDVPCIDPVQAAVKTLEGILYFCQGKKFHGIPFQNDLLGYPDLLS